jgi:hypothetical protein
MQEVFTTRAYFVLQGDRLWALGLEEDDSLVTDMFGGQLQGNVVCHGCKQRFTRYEFFKVQSRRNTLAYFVCLGGFECCLLRGLRMPRLFSPPVIVKALSYKWVALVGATSVILQLSKAAE